MSVHYDLDIESTYINCESVKELQLLECLPHVYCLGVLLFRVDYADRVQTALDLVDDRLKDYPNRIKAEAQKKDNAAQQSICKTK